MCTVWWSVSSFSTLSNPSHDIWIRNISVLGGKSCAGCWETAEASSAAPHRAVAWSWRISETAQAPWMNATRLNQRVKEPQHPSKRTESWSTEGKPGPTGNETPCPTWKGANQPPTQATRRQRWLQRPIRSGYVWPPCSPMFYPCLSPRSSWPSTTASFGHQTSPSTPPPPPLSPPPRAATERRATARWRHRSTSTPPAPTRLWIGQPGPSPKVRTPNPRISTHTCPVTSQTARLQRKHSPPGESRLETRNRRRAGTRAQRRLRTTLDKLTQITGPESPKFETWLLLVGKRSQAEARPTHSLYSRGSDSV